jgi:ATP-dependent DNA helicase RecQ
VTLVRDAATGFTAALAPAAAELLVKLKAWRLQESREQGVPAYVILHDATLASVANANPGSIEELAGIAGFGAKRLERYGPTLLSLIAAGPSQS